jgi:hypothetical protein
MCSRGRRPTAALRKKQRSDEDWRRREGEQRRCKISVRRTGRGALEEESPRKKKKWGVKRDKSPHSPIYTQGTEIVGTTVVFHYRDSY